MTLLIRAVLTAWVLKKWPVATPLELKDICLYQDQIFGERFQNEEPLVEISATLVRGEVFKLKFK